MRLFGREKFQRTFLQRIEAEYRPNSKGESVAAVVNIKKLSHTPAFHSSAKKDFIVKVPPGVYAGQPLLVRIEDENFRITCPNFARSNNENPFFIVQITS